jgi:hypothetical protein
MWHHDFSHETPERLAVLRFRDTLTAWSYRSEMDRRIESGIRKMDRAQSNLLIEQHSLRRWQKPMDYWARMVDQSVRVSGRRIAELIRSKEPGIAQAATQVDQLWTANKRPLRELIRAASKLAKRASLPSASPTTQRRGQRLTAALAKLQRYHRDLLGGHTVEVQAQRKVVALEQRWEAAWRDLVQLSKRLPAGTRGLETLRKRIAAAP